MIKLFDAFAGYGGAHFSLTKAKIDFEPVGFSENDPFASSLYELNHPGVKNYGDITEIVPKNLPDFNFFTGGFPCQPFSSAGLGEGEGDTRGTLFHDILRVCENKKPEFILLENVKGLVTKRHTSTLNTIKSKLRGLGYYVHVELLNTKYYGIPQNRERVWIYARLDGKKSDYPDNFTLAPEKYKVDPIPHLKYFLDENPEDELYRSKKQIERLEEIHKVNFNVEDFCCLDIYNKKIRTDGISITITEPHHNTLRIVEPPIDGVFRVRKLSKAEHFRLMGFDDGQIDFGEQSYQQICKRAGNGWDINLGSIIMKTIFEKNN